MGWNWTEDFERKYAYVDFRRAYPCFDICLCFKAHPWIYFVSELYCIFADFARFIFYCRIQFFFTIDDTHLQG